jgi:vitamin B12 transporter
MYGADAGGVVAITTRQPTEAFSADLSAEMGSNTFQRLGATLTGGSEYVYGSISAATVDTNNFNAREIDNIAPDDDGYQNKSLHATLTAVLSEQWRAGGSAHGVDGANDYDGCFDPDTFATVNNCTDDYAQLAWRSYINWFNDKTDVIASYEQNTIERQYFTEAVKTFETDGGHEELSVIANLQLPSDQRLTMGSDFLVQSLNDGNETRSRNNRAFFAEYARNFLSGNIQVGYRTDDNDDFGRHNSWRVSTFQPLSLTTIPLALTAAVGTGFRAPSLYEIAYNKGPFAYAPASEQRLLAETSKGWEVGLRMGTPEQQITATWFSQDISNEIYFDLSGYSGYLQRPGDNRSEGLEIEGIATLNPQLSVKGNVTFNRTEDALSNQRPYRPELTAAVSLIWQNSWLTASLIGRHTQNVVDTEGEPMADYTLLDCSFAANLSDSLQITARIENLTNDTYQQIQGYFSAQRAWYLGLRYQH